MRPGEVCQLRWRDIDRSGNVWAYRPAQHKMQWQGKDRVVSIGPRAQAVLKKYEERDPAAPLFSPKEAVEQFHRERGQRRVTTYYPSRQGWQQRKAEPKRKPKDMYTVTAYGQAIRRACKKAKIPLWKPNQIRHTRATEVRDQYGLEAAQVVLGHANADVTDMARSPERDTSPCEEVGLIVSEMAKRNHNNSESPSILHRSQDRA
jgi:integrase